MKNIEKNLISNLRAASGIKYLVCNFSKKINNHDTSEVALLDSLVSVSKLGIIGADL